MMDGLLLLVIGLILAASGVVVLVLRNRIAQGISIISGAHSHLQQDVEERAARLVGVAAAAPLVVGAILIVVFVTETVFSSIQ